MEPHADSGDAERNGGRDIDGFKSSGWGFRVPGLPFPPWKFLAQFSHERGLPAYVLFSDATLRGMARLRPRSPAELLRVHGVGERKLSDFGQRFLERIAIYCFHLAVLVGKRLS
jgi:hypothetical protein